jgi:uncharacterized protein YabN with tetrapyrrole methylase and pyrophosphatase domain
MSDSAPIHAPTAAPTPHDLAAAQAACARLLAVMDRLRDPDGCPWDREQTLRTLTPYLLEEAHEVIEAIESGDVAHHKEELGDLLFQVVFHARIAREAGWFDFAGVCDGIAEKLRRRHPHVFGTGRPSPGGGEPRSQEPDSAGPVTSSAEVVRNWEQIKTAERAAMGEKPRSAIGGVPASLPALVRAERLTEKAAAVGFDWPDRAGVLAKVREELSELEAELAADARGPSRVEAELGDLLFSIANLGRFAKVHPEEALRGAIRRFERRFHFIEAELERRGTAPARSTLEEMDALWEEAKRGERR